MLRPANFPRDSCVTVRSASKNRSSRLTREDPRSEKFCFHFGRRRETTKTRSSILRKPTEVMINSPTHAPRVAVCESPVGSKREDSIMGRYSREYQNDQRKERERGKATIATFRKSCLKFTNDISPNLKGYYCQTDSKFKFLWLYNIVALPTHIYTYVQLIPLLLTFSTLIKK